LERGRSREQGERLTTDDTDNTDGDGDFTGRSGRSRRGMGFTTEAQRHGGEQNRAAQSLAESQIQAALLREKNEERVLSRILRSVGSLWIQRTESTEGTEVKSKGWIRLVV
jgi:hypothetical protein